MIDEDDQNYASEDAYDAAPLLTKNYGSCANASRLRLDPPSKRRRSFAQRRRYFCLAYGFGLAFLGGAGVREKLVQMIQCVTISHQCWRRDRSDTGWCTCLAAKWHALRLAAASISRWSQGPKLDSSPHRSLQHYSCTLAALREPQPG